MRFFLLLSLLFLGVFANSELTQIEASIKKASTDFELQKSENNITKLLSISKILYENNKKIKELKAKYIKKVSIKLSSKKELNRLQVEDIVELHVETFHNKSEEYKKSDLNFFIYDGDELLATKDVELYEKGGVHKESLKFEITKPSQNYKVCAVFKESEKEYKECKTFSVSQPVEAKDIVASTSLDATSSDVSFTPNREFYLFMPFKNSTQTTLNGKVTITDTKSGKVVLSKEFEKVPAKGFKKAGLLVPDTLVKQDRVLHVVISLKAKGINPIEKEQDIKISTFKWSANFPTKLDAKDKKSFTISPPKTFAKPLKVDVDVEGGILIGYKKNTLSGTISAVTNKKERAYATVLIEDAYGNRVNKRVPIYLNQNAVVVPEVVEQIPKPAPPPVYKLIKSKKKIAVGATKMMECSVYTGIYGTYHGKCQHRYDGRFWKQVDGEFRLYYDYTEKDTSDSSFDKYALKNALAIVGHSKNQKLDGKMTSYYGNGKVESVHYYNNGKMLDYPEISYYLTGNLRYTEKIVDGNKISAFFNKDKSLRYYVENIKGYMFDSSYNKMTIKDPNGYKICTVKLSDKMISEVVCYYPNDKDRPQKVGKKYASLLIRAKFYNRSDSQCTNRFDSNGRFSKCNGGEEDYFMKRLTLFSKILGKSKENGNYLKGYDASNFDLFFGDSIYYSVFNSILSKRLFVPSNPSKKCKGRYGVKWGFKQFDTRMSRRNKRTLFKKAAKQSYRQNKKMIMSIFANEYYKRERKDRFCYTELRNFYKQLGYLHAY